MEYYSVLKKKEILTHATIWMNLEDIVLSEISQSQKDKYGVIPLMWGTQSSQVHRNGKQNGSFQKLGGRGFGESYLLIRCRVSVWDCLGWMSISSRNSFFKNKFIYL